MQIKKIFILLTVILLPVFFLFFVKRAEEISFEHVTLLSKAKLYAYFSNFCNIKNEDDIIFQNTSQTSFDNYCENIDQAVDVNVKEIDTATIINNYLKDVYLVTASYDKNGELYLQHKIKDEYLEFYFTNGKYQIDIKMLFLKYHNISKVKTIIAVKFSGDNIFENTVNKFSFFSQIKEIKENVNDYLQSKIEKLEKENENVN